MTVEGSGAANAATAAKGGTLTILGQSDIFNLDTFSAYYTVSTSWSAVHPSALRLPDASTSPPKRLSPPTWPLSSRPLQTGA